MKTSKDKYSVEIDKPRHSGVGNQWEFHVTFIRKIAKYQEERITLFLCERMCFASIYINRFKAAGIIELDKRQVSELMDNDLSIEDTFEYCRKRFCRDLSKKQTTKSKKNKNPDSKFGLQLGLFA